MQKPENPTFVILFSVNRDEPNVRRFVLLRQYLAAEARADAKMIDQAILSNGYYQFMVIAEVASREILEEALTHCKGIINVRIVPVENIFVDCRPAEKRYALFAKNNASKSPAFTRNSEQLCAAVNLHLRAELCDEAPYSTVLLVDAPSLSVARQYGEYLLPESNVFCVEATAPAALLKKIESAANGSGQTTEESTESKSEPQTINEAITADFEIVNQGNAAVTIAPLTGLPGNPTLPLDYYNLFTNTRPLAAQSSFDTNDGVYIWPSTSGQLNFTWMYWFETGTTISIQDIHRTVPAAIDCNAVPPTLFSPYMPKIKAGFDVTKDGGFQAITPLQTWLNDLLNSTKYDAAWIEDGYTGDDLAAYNYFVSQLKGVHPKSGSVPEGDMQSWIDYGCPPNINQKSFDTVGAHLVKECSYFEIAAKWFDVNGIFSILNMQIAAVSANDLTSAANLMQIQNPESDIEAVLDAAFWIMAAFVAVIPDVGPIISAVVITGWETAKTVIWEPGASSSPIQASIAAMADKLNAYLGGMEAANAHNFATIKSNWGKLQTFGNGTIGEPPLISSDQFGVTVAPNGDPIAPQNYIASIAKAWKLVIYQSLFAAFHTPQCYMSVTDTMPTNPWNPDAGNYEYVFFLDCKHYDSNGNLVKGFVEFDCTTDAPTAVMQLLFGSQSEYNLNPLVFFTGVNGWKPAFIYNSGKIDDPGDSPEFGAFGSLGRLP